ncbi:MAG: PadR family transcriptional regulator [Longimicrobiales bacterium]|nr:PadR family transcriptional regulator [Longimicrobiales bacterium]
MTLEREWTRGAAPLAVLTLLERREMYGYELVEALDRDSDGLLALGQSTVYPLLYNLEGKGHVEAFWREAPNGRRRKYYRATPSGLEWLAAQRGQWEKLVEAMRALGVSEAATEREA